MSGTGELDHERIRSAQAGDRRAARALVRCYQARVFRLACRVAGSELAEDVTQEAFGRVFRSLPGFDPAGPARLSRWVLGIAARTAIDQLRRRRTRMTTLRAVPEPLGPETPDATAQRAEIGRRVAAAVATLGPDIRATFVLRAYHELTMVEVADALEVELGTVKSRLSRARESLRHALGDLWDDHARGGEFVAS